MYIEAPDKRKPIGVLMIEHRLIERALDSLEGKVAELAQNPDVIGLAELIDFFGTYADATHHGKEEDIMFVDADAMEMDEELAKTLAELRDDHVRFRAFRRAMDEAVRKMAKGDDKAAAALAGQAGDFIPRLREHIKKEDKIFFPGFDAKQDKAGRDGMMEQFKIFDMEIIHDSYRQVVEHQET